MVDVATRLREARLQKGCTATEVANACGITRSSVQMYECGLRIPRDSVKIKLAQFYGISVQDLFF